MRMQLTRKNMDPQAQKPLRDPVERDFHQAPPKATPTVTAVGSSSLPMKSLVSPSTTCTLSVIKPTTGGRSVVVSAQHSTTFPKPPPLITTVSGTPSTQGAVGTSTNTNSASDPASIPPIKTSQNPQATETSIPQTLGEVKSKTPQVHPMTTDTAGITKSIRNILSGVGNRSGEGLGAGKPKAFLAMMASITKKQPTKRAPGNSKATKGQGTKKGSPSSLAAHSKKGDQQAPSRTSNRSIKRPRTYDEDLDDLKMLKQPLSKKAKGTPKITKLVGRKSATTFTATTGVKDLGRWRPTDDLMLISAVQQTNDLTAVHLGVNFSCRFTLQEVEERWHALLYSHRISPLAVEAMRALHPGVVTMALNNALWSQEEEAVLARIPSTDPGHLEKFQAVLKENPAVFHTCRTATSLHHHWVLMGHNGLLNNQKVDLIPPEENIKEFADAEDRLEDSELMRPRDVREEALEQEVIASDRQAKMEIMKLEEELPLWRTAIHTGSSPDFGPNDYAVLKGKIVEFRMMKRMVILGRSTSNNSVDFDLSLEAPAFKISRRQATIQLTDNGEFMLHNEGRRPVYVSGKAIVAKTSTKILHNQILEVASMSFLIWLNSKLASSVKNSNSQQQSSVQ